MVAIKRTRPKQPTYTIPDYPDTTFHIMIIASGKPCLLTMLNSLRDELTEDDAITIIFNGDGMFEKSTFNHRWLKGHDSTINIMKQPSPLHEHELRNEYQMKLKKKTTFIMHANDDDMYLPGSFHELRIRCFAPHTLYIGKMYLSLFDMMIPLSKYPNKVGFACGIIPFHKVGDALWTDEIYSTYYHELQQKVELVSFITTPIYQLSDSMKNVQFQSEST
jgi:hypothetical protein